MNEIAQILDIGGGALMGIGILFTALGIVMLLRGFRDMGNEEIRRIRQWLRRR